MARTRPKNSADARASTAGAWAVAMGAAWTWPARAEVLAGAAAKSMSSGVVSAGGRLVAVRSITVMITGVDASNPLSSTDSAPTSPSLVR